MAINAIKKMREDLENNTSQIVGDMKKANAGTAAVATTAANAGTAAVATTAAYAGTSAVATTAAYAGTAHTTA